MGAGVEGTEGHLESGQVVEEEEGVGDDKTLWTHPDSIFSLIGFFFV